MSAVGQPVSTPADTTAADTTAADSTAADSTAADSVAAIAHRYPHAFASNGAPLWRAGGMVSTPREAELLRTVASALPLLLALWWVALSLRSLAVDRRRRGSLIVLLGVLGAFGWAVVGPWAIVWATAGSDDRYGTGPALLAALAAACLSALVMSWAIANPRVTIAGILSLPAPVIIGTELATTPTIPGSPLVAAARAVPFHARWSCARPPLRCRVLRECRSMP